MKTQSAIVNTSDLTPATAVATASIASSDSASSNVSFSAPALSMGAAAFSGNVSDAASKIAGVKGGEVEMVFYQKVSMGTGNQANNPWLQEVTDPISKATWDNYAMISPEMGKSLFGIDIFKPT